MNHLTAAETPAHIWLTYDSVFSLTDVGSVHIMAIVYVSDSECADKYFWSNTSVLVSGVSQLEAGKDTVLHCVFYKVTMSVF